MHDTVKIVHVEISRRASVHMSGEEQRNRTCKMQMICVSSWGLLRFMQPQNQHELVLLGIAA